MVKKQLYLLVLFSLCLVLAAACGANSGGSSVEDTGVDGGDDASMDGDTGGDTDADADISDGGDSDSIQGSDWETGSATDGDTSSEADTATDTADANSLNTRIVNPDDGDSFLTDETLRFECRARSDTGGASSSLTYTWSIEPAGLSFMGREVASGLPEGIHNVICTVTDSVSGASDSDQITVTVGDVIVEIRDPNDGAVFRESSPGSGQSEPIDFSARGESTSGPGGTFSWQIGTVATLLGEEVQTALPVGKHTVTVTFEDTAGNTATDVIEIEVLTHEAWQECRSAEEVCNGVDDNCNGDVDEGEISCGVGECRRRVDRCVGGVDNVCVPRDPEPEECNGRDDDCDGDVDEHDGDVDSLCPAANEVCWHGNCEQFEIADECTTCPCNQCENDWDWELCCEFPGVGSGAICIDQNFGEPCPVI